MVADDVNPSHSGAEVARATNAAAAQLDDEIVLLLEVSEGPRTRISPPADASTLDLTGVEPRVQQLGEGRQSEDLVSSAHLDPVSNRESSTCSCPCARWPGLMRPEQNPLPSSEWWSKCFEL